MLEEEDPVARLNLVNKHADRARGAGSSLDKWGFGAGYRTGIGEKNEFSVGFYHLNNDNGMNYGMPFIRKVGVQSAPASELLPLPPERFRVAAFYSISNCEPGLRNVSLGNFLIKRVAEQLHCSRGTAEQYIEGGFVSVGGQVVEALLDTEPMQRLFEACTVPGKAGVLVIQLVGGKASPKAGADPLFWVRDSNERQLIRALAERAAFMGYSEVIVVEGGSEAVFSVRRGGALFLALPGKVE